MNFDQNVINICSWRSNQQYSNIGSDDDSVMIRWQAITWTNDG